MSDAETNAVARMADDSGFPVMSRMSQRSPVSWRNVPMYETVPASHKARNARCRSGVDSDDRSRDALLDTANFMGVSEGRTRTP